MSARATRFEVTVSWWETTSNGRVFFATQPYRFDDLQRARASAQRQADGIATTNPAADEIEPNVVRIEFIETDGTLRELFRNTDPVAVAEVVPS